MRFYRRSEKSAWSVDFWHNGQRFRVSTGTPDREKAQEWAERRKGDLWREGRLGERPAVSWDAAVLDWLANNQDLKSLADRKDQLRWASTELAGRALSTIDRSELDRLAKKKAAELAKRKGGGSPSTVNRHLAAISAVLGHAVAKEWLDARPSVPRRKEGAPRVRWATQEQAAKLIANLPQHLRPMVSFALTTGLRRYNVTHLEWSAVDLRRRIAWVHADEAKGGRVISVPLNDDATAILRGQRGQHKRVVFPYKGRAMVRPESAGWKAACKKAGLPGFRWHDLRHTWASWHVQRGTPLAALQQLGGWRSISMVLRYAHLGESHLAAYAGNARLAQNQSHDAPRGTSSKAA